MRAAVVRGGGRLAVCELPDPQPGPGEVVVRVAACGICGSDLHMLEAGLLAPGTVPGHEAAGVVEAAGPGVEGLGAGDPVAIYPTEPCGACAPCQQGRPGLCESALGRTIGLGLRPGALAERVAVSASMAHRLPEGFPVEAGALAEPLTVALHGLRRARLRPGERVGVIGCGPIGLCAVAAARALGAGHVWAADPNGFRAGLARALGAAQRRAGEEADVVVECAGASGTLQEAVGAVRGGGRVALVAVRMADDVVQPFVWVMKEVEVVASYNHGPGEFREALGLLVSGRVELSPIITRRVPLEGADEAFQALRGGAAEGKVLVTP